MPTLTAEQEFEANTMRRVSWRLMPFLLLAYLICYIDRVNVGFAALQMNKAVGIDPKSYGLGAGIFFVGYFIFEVPSNLALQKFGARKWIARIMISWGLCSAAFALIGGPISFLVLRFLLGVAEAGFFPGVILYLTYWYPAPRRAGIIALFMTAIPIAGVIGGPLSGWILHAMTGAQGLAGWQWLFLIEAIPSLALGVAVFVYLGDGIEGGRWLTVGEKDLLRRRLAGDNNQVSYRALRDGFTNTRLLLLAAIYFCLIAGLYGASFWMPTLIEQSGVRGPLAIVVLTVLPNAAGAIAMVGISRHSDAARDRRWHLVIPAIVGAVGWLLTVRYGANSAAALLGMSLAMAGVTTSLSQFWCLPTAILAGAAAATGIALVNSFGNLAGFLSPWAIGWIIDRTHSTDLGVYALAGVLAVGSLLVLTIPGRIVNR